MDPPAHPEVLLAAVACARRRERQLRKLGLKGRRLQVAQYSTPLRLPHAIGSSGWLKRVFQPPDAENRTSGGVGGCRGAIPVTRPDPVPSLLMTISAGFYAPICRNNQNKKPASRIDAGSVSTQAIARLRTFPHCSPDRLAAMVPATPEESTCVVLTSMPNQSAAPMVTIAVISAAAPCA